MVNKNKKTSGFTILRRSSGFTIVELLVVIVVIGILATITIVSYTGISQRAKVAAIQSDLTNSSKQIKLFQVTEASGNYPTANNCPTPGASEICLRLSNGNTYTYAPSNGTNPKTFTLDATNGSTTYRITNDSVPVNVATVPITAIATITGTPQISQILTAGATTPAAATITYQWQVATTSGGTYTNISGATASTYTLNPSHVNKYLKVIVTGTGDYTGTQTSAATTAVAVDANWLTIGTQTWAKANLNVGTMVTSVTTQSNNSILEKYCPNNAESNCTTYGGLYLWDEAMQYVTTAGAQGICPTGSHIPTDNEWKILEIQLGMTQAQADGTSWRGTDQGTQLKSGGSSGLNMLLAGLRDVDGSFVDFSSSAVLWSSSDSSTNVWVRSLFSYATVNRVADPKYYGFSVRCMGN